jgi:formylglycine-generating enzyme required for sulfatase activity
MIGNVWEWTCDWWRERHSSESCFLPKNPRGGPEAESRDRSRPEIPRKVLKGGSHLSAPNHCRRYRPAARQPEPVDASSGHVGFRCVVRRGSRP